MNRLRSCLASLHRDEQGDEGVNKLLIVALIVVPLLIALIAFKDKLVPFFEKAWKSIVK
jgi:Flp pilus assembly pilin Flp